MTKQKNATVGTIACTCCEAPADIRQNSSGKYYIHCATCGTDNRHGAGFQAYILAHGTLHNGPGPDEADPDPEDMTIPGAGAVASTGNGQTYPARETGAPARSVDADDAGGWLGGLLW